MLRTQIMEATLKKFGNQLAWGTLGLVGIIAASQLAVQRYAPMWWCAAAGHGSKGLVCGFSAASLWYLAYLGVLALVTGASFMIASWSWFLGGVQRHGRFAYVLSAVLVFGAIIAITVSSGELNEL